MSKRKGRLKGVDIRPGSARQARQEAGLSLSAVAGTEVTRAAIHLVESGRSRPSMPTLDLIARRTGKPVSFFLAPRMATAGAFIDKLEEVELQILSGRPQRAIELGAELLTFPLSPWGTGRLRLFLGQAYSQLGRHDALDHLNAGRAVFLDIGERELASEAFLGIIEELDKSGAGSIRPLIEEALEEERQLPIRQPLVEASLRALQAKHGSQPLAEQAAIDLFEQALGEAERTIELEVAADRHERARERYQTMGDSDRGRAHLQQAVALRRLLRQERQIVRLESRLGEALLRREHYEKAEGRLSRALERAEKLGLTDQVTGLLLAMAEIELKRDDVRGAERSLARARALAADGDDEREMALAIMLTGRLLAKRNELEAATEHFERAIEAFERLASPSDLVRCHTIFASVLEEAGDTGGALAQAKLALAATRTVTRPAD